MKFKVDSRRTLLTWLRASDYKKFEWLLEKLNIVYKPRPLVRDILDLLYITQAPPPPPPPSIYIVYCHDLNNRLIQYLNGPDSKTV